MSVKILVVDDEPAMRLGLQQVLKKEGYEVEVASDGEQALARMSAQAFAAVVTDLRMPKRDGMAVLAHAKTLNPEPLVFMITAYGDVPTAVQAMQGGATDFILKPFKIDDVRTRVKTALLAAEPRAPASEAAEVGVEAEFPGIITRSPKVREVLQTIKKIANTNCTVLVLGETGTGKEAVSRAIHTKSHRAEGPFIATSGTIPVTLLESELFGHKKGAFTDAREDKVGYFEAADGGTFFLDEVGDLPMSMQVKLLRVIQEGEINRVGDPIVRKVSVRLVAATNKNLREEIAAKRFREDLFYRLNVISLTLPPLRERGDDIPLLARYFLAVEGPKLGRSLELGDDAAALLMAQPWPGNIRQLKHCVQRIAIYAEDDLIDAAAVEMALED